MSITSKNNYIYKLLTDALTANSLDVVHTVRSPQELQKKESPLFYFTIDKETRDYEAEDGSIIVGTIEGTLFAGTKVTNDTAKVGKARISIEDIAEKVENAWQNTSGEGVYTDGGYTYTIYIDSVQIAEIFTYPDEGESKGWIEIKTIINYKRSY